MSEEQGSPSGMREHNPSAAAAGPAGEAIARRVFSRLGRSRGMIPPEAAEELPGRIARLAQGRLPLLDALQRRWVSSAAAWPDASDLPLMTGFAGARGVEMAFQVGDTRSSPASSAGTLPIVEARPAGRDTTISDPLRGWSEGEAGPAASQPDIAGAAPRTTVGSGLTETRPALPVVKVSRSPAQRDSALPAAGVATGALPTPAAGPLPVMRGQTATDDRGRPATAPLQRRIFATGDEPAAASRSPDATGAEIPAHPGAATEPDERPVPLMRAQVAPVGASAAAAMPLQRASADDPNIESRAAHEASGAGTAASAGLSGQQAQPAKASTPEDNPNFASPAHFGAAPEPAERPTPVVRAQAAPSGTPVAIAMPLQRAAADDPNIGIRAAHEASSAGTSASAGLSRQPAQPAKASTPENNPNLSSPAHPGAAPEPAERPTPVVRAPAASSGTPVAIAMPLQRAAADDLNIESRAAHDASSAGTAASAGLSGQQAQPAKASTPEDNPKLSSPARSGTAPEPAVRPTPVVRAPAAPSGTPVAIAMPLQRAAADDPNIESRAAHDASSAGTAASAGLSGQQAQPAKASTPEDNPNLSGPARSGAAPEPAERPTPVVRAPAAPSGTPVALAMPLQRAAADDPNIESRAAHEASSAGTAASAGPSWQQAQPAKAATPEDNPNFASPAHFGAAPGPAAQTLPVVRAQAAPVVRTPPAPAPLARRASETGGEPPGDFAERPESDERAADSSRAIHLPPATAVVRRETSPAPTLRRSLSEPGGEAGRSAGKQDLPTARVRAESVTEARPASIAGRIPAPGVTRVWGEPIMQRVRGRQEAPPSVAADGAAIADGTALLLQAAGAGTLPLHHLPGAGIETATATASSPIVSPEKMAGHDKAAVEQAFAGRDVPPRLENPSVSLSPGAGLPGNGSGSRSGTKTVSLGASTLPVAAPIARSPLTPARPGGHDALSASRRADAAAILRHTVPERTAPVQTGQMGQTENLPTLPISPVVSIMPEDYAGAARPSLPRSVERRASSATIALPLQRQESSAFQRFPIQRQAESSPDSAPPSAAGGSQATTSAGENQAESSPESPGEGRVRLDEIEMERVTNTVMQRLKQHLQMEREARGM